MIPGNFNALGPADVERLVADRVPEGKSIEYKSALPGGADGDRKEFLADVSSFANTSGGDLVFGIDEDQGIPQRIVPVTIADVDLEQRRLDNLIRDGIRPRLEFAIRVIDLGQSQKIVIIRVPRGWTGPHRVTFQGHDKFYGRTTAGKYPLDVDELRTAFTLSQTVVDRIRAFRVDRIISLSNNAAPVPCVPGGKIVLHLIPLAAFASSATYDVLQFVNQPQWIRPMRAGGWSTRITFEGVLSLADNPAISYTHVFRNGIIEAVECTQLNNQYQGVRTIPSVSYERVILEYLPRAFDICRAVGIAPPLAVSLTLTNVRGIQMGVRRFFDDDDYYPIEVDTLSLPETVVEQLDVSPAAILRPMFDLVWNACGQARSPNFNVDGQWAPQPAI